jgi:hypothetical protein
MSMVDVNDLENVHGLSVSLQRSRAVKLIAPQSDHGTNTRCVSAAALHHNSFLRALKITSGAHTIDRALDPILFANGIRLVCRRGGERGGKSSVQRVSPGNHLHDLGLDIGTVASQIQVRLLHLLRRGRRDSLTKECL